MRIMPLFFVVALALGTPASAADGVVSASSALDVKATMDKLEGGVKEAGFTVIARVDHAAAAAKVDQKLRPTELPIFGNPKGGTPLRQA